MAQIVRLTISDEFYGRLAAIARELNLDVPAICRLALKGGVIYIETVFPGMAGDGSGVDDGWLQRSVEAYLSRRRAEGTD